VNHNDFTPPMWAARLHGPRDLRIEQIPAPSKPTQDQVLLRVTAVGVCGSDLHTYRHACIGDTRLEGPLVLGHEFAGVVEQTGPQAVDGAGRQLVQGMAVAVDPAQPCGRCELCQAGHPNLCTRLRFCGLWPDNGSLCQWIVVPAETCFAVPDSIDPVTAAMLEPLGIGIHAVDLAKLRVAKSLAIVGAGTIGLCILQVARAAGADPIFVSDKFPWRLDLARKLGASQVFQHGRDDVVAAVQRSTAGRGVDVAVEAAWCDESVEEAAEMLVYGGRLVVAGISEDDRLTVRHSTARRKGLTIVLVRRMKHAYPRAIRLAQSGKVDLSSLVTHRYPLARTAEAFDVMSEYRDGVVKAVVEIGGQRA
jgi:L-iditol 2-dehydrogenase